MKRVLVVDDEDSIRLMLTDVLEAHGYEVTTAANGREALEEVERHPPAVVVLDAIMPVMDGLTFLHEQRRRRDLPYVPTMVISAYPDRAEARMIEFGVEGFLPKPSDLESWCAWLTKSPLVNQRRTRAVGSPTHDSFWTATWPRLLMLAGL
jgi:CheY-like chemotaxis protein